MTTDKQIYKKRTVNLK